MYNTHLFEKIYSISDIVQQKKETTKISFLQQD